MGYVDRPLRDRDPETLPRNYLTTQEVADLLKLRAHSVATWRMKGVGPEYIKIGRMVRYPAARLREWIESHREEASNG